AQRDQPFTAGAAARYLGRQIAEHVVGRAHIVLDDVVQERVGLARLIKLRRRYPEPFLMDVTCARADAVATDVGVMDGRADVTDQPLAQEDRAENGDVEE